ncbi:MAG: histidine kinase [Burkholderiales bacterium]|nr:histidine kinase [Burkholderiales bacterium]
MPNVSSVNNSEPLIPDCCNAGVVFRILLGSNLVILLGIFSRGDNWLSNWQNFVESSMLIETICLTSLLLLCSLRRWVYRHALSDWAQRLLCAVIPALIASGLLFALDRLEWFSESFPRLNFTYAVLLCMILGILFQQYFELRTRANSPALGEARLQALQARIRPHFLFNSLNTALSLIRSDPRRAETVLEDLADLFRVLMRDTRNLTSLQDEIRLCEQYLAIEKIRLGERLQVEWHRENLYPEDLAKTEIPSLLLQPLIENAVHYGVEPSLVTATIHIELKKNLDKIEICVRNPHHAASSLPSGNQMALENIRQRLSLLYDIEAQISYGIVDSQFKVSLTFPARR